ncbi:MAG: type II secretion system protein, partial [Candidatus Brocadiia bacterium]
MKSTIKTTSKRRAYTIIELLTVMSIIVILSSMLVPAMNKVRQFAQKVKQNAQFHSIGVALELFQAETEKVPDSSAFDPGSTIDIYCGAEKLAEAMMGQDLLGFHPDSVFRRSGWRDMPPDIAPPNKDLYPKPNTAVPAEYIKYKENLKARIGPFLPLENANIYPLTEIYNNNILTTNGFIAKDADGENYANYVLCDVYTRVTNNVTGQKIGMPILYYKADTSKNSHYTGDVAGVNNPGYDNSDNIYNYVDNDALVRLGMPWAPGFDHPMSTVVSGQTTTGGVPTPAMFYQNIRNKKISASSRPNRADTYILLSA